MPNFVFVLIFVGLIGKTNTHISKLSQILVQFLIEMIEIAINKILFIYMKSITINESDEKLINQEFYHRLLNVTLVSKQIIHSSQKQNIS